jgi:DNA-binding transcriptional LysR family regulator
MVDVRGLQLLHQLNLRGTLSSAAEALYLSHSAASHRLSVLEREVGVPVTERIGRRLRLTETGAALAACAQRLQREIEATGAVIEQARGTVAGRVRIGLFQTAALRILPNLLSELRDEYPEVILESTQTLAATALAAVQTGELDLAVVPSYQHHAPPEASGTLHHEHLYTDHWFLVLPPDHRLCQATAPIDITELRSEKWIAGETVTHFLARLCQDAGFEPRVVHRSSEYTVMTTLVSRGHGISFMPIIDELNSLLPPVALRQLNIPSAHQTVLAVLREGSRNRPAVDAVWRLMLRRGREI